MPIDPAKMQKAAMQFIAITQNEKTQAVHVYARDTEEEIQKDLAESGGIVHAVIYGCLLKVTTRTETVIEEADE